MNLTDPSGHDPWWCDNRDVIDPAKCYSDWISDWQNRIGDSVEPSSKIEPTITPLACATPTPLNFSLPDINDIPDMETTPPSVKKLTIKRYGEFRRALYDQDHQYVDGTGKIRDDVLAALIISAELIIVKGRYPEIYRETLEALSNQYDSGRKIGFSNPGNMLCYGSCTIKTQIAWLYDIEGIRADNFIGSKIKSKVWATYLTDGQSAVSGYVNGQNSSWFWGNVTQDELCKYLTVKQVHAPDLYPNKPYFIVHRGRSGSTECK